MDNRERGYRDASLGFGTNLQMMTKWASNIIAAPLEPAPPAQTKTQSDEEGGTMQTSARPSVEMPSTASSSAAPNWIRATASCSMSVFADTNESSQAYGKIDTGDPVRLFLPILADGDDQWAKVQFVSGKLGDLTMGWTKVASSKHYFVENLSV
jgi:hypothetical protein